VTPDIGCKNFLLSINLTAKFCSISKNIDCSLNALFGNTKKVIKNRIRLTLIPKINIIFVKERNEKPELVIATISASDTSLLMAYIVEKKAATGITK
jgi:hypothetical protein